MTCDDDYIFRDYLFYVFKVDGESQGDISFLIITLVPLFNQYFGRLLARPLVDRHI